MDIARRLFNDQHPTTSLIDLFGKRYKIDENDKVFWWLCLNKASNYLTYMRICELADHCCVTKSDRGFDIKVDMNENLILVKDIKEWLLTRKNKDRYGNDFGTIENICSFRICKWKWIILRQISQKKNLKLLQKKFYQLCQNVDCVEIFAASGINFFFFTM